MRMQLPAIGQGSVDDNCFVLTLSSQVRVHIVAVNPTVSISEGRLQVPDAMASSRRALCRRLVYGTFGNFREPSVGFFLFAERLFEQFSRVFVAKLAGESSGRAVRGHLVMLDPLASRDQ